MVVLSCFNDIHSTLAISLQHQKPSLRFNAKWVIGHVATSCIAIYSMVRSRTMESDEESHSEGAESKERDT